MVATRKTNQVDIDLSKISDEGTRIAVAQLQEAMNDLIGKGLDTEGFVKARLGVAAGVGGETNPLCWQDVAGDIKPNTGAQDHYDTVKVQGRIFGVVGWAQYAGSEEWRGMGRSTVTDSIFITNGVGAPFNLEDTVVFQNTDLSNRNAYRAVIFFQPSVVDRARTGTATA